MKTYLTYDIFYDFSDCELSNLSEPKLSQNILINVPKEIALQSLELEDYLANEISDKTGFCVEVFSYKPITS